jgi:hypothetical protein
VGCRALVWETWVRVPYRSSGFLPLFTELPRETSSQNLRRQEGIREPELLPPALLQLTAR